MVKILSRRLKRQMSLNAKQLLVWVIYFNISNKPLLLLRDFFDGGCPPNDRWLWVMVEILFRRLTSKWVSFLTPAAAPQPACAARRSAAHATRSQAQLARGNSMAKYVSSSRVASKKIKVWLMTSPYDLKPPLSPRWHACCARRAAAVWRGTGGGGVARAAHHFED